MAVGDSAPRSRSRRQWVRIPPKGEDFFQGKNLRWAMEVCVCVSGADGRVGRVQIPAVHGCRVVCVLCRPERRKERRGWALSRLLVEVF
jgi:hypothetical protein